MDITVVGAGVIGLTTALTLEQRGHRVRVVAAKRLSETTSAVAGAVWFPYRVGPPDKVPAWALRTRYWLEQIARDVPQAGVDVLTGYEILGDDGTTRPWWAAAPTMEGDELATAGVDVPYVPSPVTDAPHGWRFVA